MEGLAICKCKAAAYGDDYPAPRQRRLACEPQSTKRLEHGLHRCLIQHTVDCRDPGGQTSFSTMSTQEGSSSRLRRTISSAAGMSTPWISHFFIVSRLRVRVGRDYLCIV